MSLLVLLLSAAWIVACGRETSDREASGESAADEHPSIEILTDAESLADLRRRASEQQEALELDVLAGFDERLWIDSSEIALLAQDRETSVARLREISADTARKAETRLLAAHARVQLGDSDGWTVYDQLLARGSVEDRLEVLDRFSFDITGREVRLPDWLVGTIIAQADHPDPRVRAKAYWWAVRLGGREQVDLVRRRSREGTLEERHAALRILAFDASDPGVVEGLTALMEEGFDLDDVASTAVHAGKNGDERTHRMAVSLLETVLRRQLADGRRLEQQQLVYLAGNASESAADLLEQQLAESRDTFAKGRSLEGLARLRGEAMRQRLEEVLTGDPYLSGYAATALGRLSAGSADEVLIARLVEAGLENAYGSGKFVDAVFAIGGPTAEDAARQLGARLDPAERSALLARLDGLDRRSRLHRLVDAGLVGEETLDEFLEEPDDDLDWLPDSPLYRAFALLQRAGVLVWFDAETDELPVLHDQLVEMLAGASRGVFAPEALLQTWHGRIVQEEDGKWRLEEGDYTVEFIHGQRLYRFLCRDYGDWYDIEAVVAAVNRALADAGVEERFIGLRTGGQMAAYLFATPAVAGRAAATKLFEIEPSDAAAREAGEAYEAQVRESLES